MWKRAGTLTALLVVAAAVPASAEVEAGEARIIADCAAHGGALARSHTRADLRAAYAALKRKRANFQDCGQAVASRLAGFGRPGPSATRLIVKDCVENGGRLTHSYRTRALRQTFRLLNEQLKQETRCRIGIASQANGRSGPKLRVPVVIDPAPVPNLDRAQTLAVLVTHYAAFRRAGGTGDLPPASVASLAAQPNRNRPGSPVAYSADARRIGPAATPMFLMPGSGVRCASAVFGTGAAMSCAPEPGNRLAVGVTVAPGGFAVWGPVPDKITSVRILTRQKHWIAATVVDNGVYDRFGHIPLVLTYRDPAGVKHYVDFTATPGYG